MLLVVDVGNTQTAPESSTRARCTTSGVWRRCGTGPATRSPGCSPGSSRCKGLSAPKTSSTRSAWPPWCPRLTSSGPRCARSTSGIDGARRGPRPDRHAHPDHNPREVGADRIVNAVAAFERLRRAAASSSTSARPPPSTCSRRRATTSAARSRPASRSRLEALTTRAAKLIKVDLIEPENVIGKSTIEALQSGAVYGFAGEVEGIVHAIWRELGERARVVATGGLAEMIARHTDVIETVDPFLTLRGIEIVMRRQQRA